MNPFKRDDQALKKAQQEEIRAYKRLESVSQQGEFTEYSDRLIKTVVSKMIFAFTNDSVVKDWNDFCKVRGEIVARLQPLQETHEAGALARHLETQLKEFYANNNLTDQ